MAGYFRSTLEAKLSIKSGHVVLLLHAPPELVHEFPEDVTLRIGARRRADVAVAFFVEQRRLDQRIVGLAEMIFPAEAFGPRGRRPRPEHARTSMSTESELPHFVSIVSTTKSAPSTRSGRRFASCGVSTSAPLASTTLCSRGRGRDRPRGRLSPVVVEERADPFGRSGCRLG